MRLFLSTPSVGRATSDLAGNHDCFCISIHALRGEGDRQPAETPQGVADFYPRPPWGGRRGRTDVCGVCHRFLSTPSVGRATHRADIHCAAGLISIHALRGEGDR